MVELEKGAGEPLDWTVDEVVLVEFVMGKGALLDELDIDVMVLDCTADDVLLLMIDMVLLNELERVAELDISVPVGPAVTVELRIEKGALVVLELELEDPVPLGAAVVVELPMVNCALLLLDIDEDVTGALEAVGPAEAVVLLPIVKRAELELKRDDVVMPPVGIAAEEVPLPLGNGALLEVVCAMDEVVELLAEEMDDESEVLETAMPVGPAEDTVVLLPMVKIAELEELNTEEAVMVLLSEGKIPELEELSMEEVVILPDADAVGPNVTVALPVGNIAEVLETGESVELPRLVVLSAGADDIELEELLIEEVPEPEEETAEELASLDD